MKITKRQLKRIIKEERTKILKEWFSDEHDPETGERDQYEQDPQMQQVQDEIYDLAKREVGVGLDELEDMFGGMGIDAAMQAEQNGLIFMDNEVFYAAGSHELSAGPGGTRSYMGESKTTKRQLKRIIKEEKAKLLSEWFSDEHDPETGEHDSVIEAKQNLENLIKEFSTAVSRWFDQIENKLDPKVLDDPESWAIQLEEIRFDLQDVVKKMMGGNRRIR
jgi:hypothetical protein